MWRGIDNAIHKAAGPDIKSEFATFPEKSGVHCKSGESKVTKGYKINYMQIMYFSLLDQGTKMTLNWKSATKVV